MRSRARLSQSIAIGPFRFRLSGPLLGKGQVRASAGTRIGRRGWIGVSSPLGGRKARRR